MTITLTFYISICILFIPCRKCNKKHIVNYMHTSQLIRRTKNKAHRLTYLTVITNITSDTSTRVPGHSICAGATKLTWTRCTLINICKYFALYNYVILQLTIMNCLYNTVQPKICLYIKLIYS